MLVPLTGVEGGGLYRGRVGELASRAHGFLMGTVHTDRDNFFFGFSVLSLEEAGVMVWRRNENTIWPIQCRATS